MSRKSSFAIVAIFTIALLLTGCERDLTQAPLYEVKDQVFANNPIEVGGVSVAREKMEEPLCDKGKYVGFDHQKIEGNGFVVETFRIQGGTGSADFLQLVYKSPERTKALAEAFIPTSNQVVKFNLMNKEVVFIFCKGELKVRMPD